MADWIVEGWETRGMVYFVEADTAAEAKIKAANGEYYESEPGSIEDWGADGQIRENN